MHPARAAGTVVLTAGAASTDLPVATVDDDANEADGSISVTLNAGTDYTVATGKGSAAVTVRDNDAPGGEHRRRQRGDRRHVGLVHGLGQSGAGNTA